jgi:hypothetical protein
MNEGEASVHFELDRKFFDAFQGGYDWRGNTDECLKFAQQVSYLSQSGAGK